MIVVYADMSLSYKKEVAAYAFRVIFQGAMTSKSGLLDPVKDTHAAEVMAIQKALSYLAQFPLPAAESITVYSDCMPAIYVIRKQKHCISLPVIFEHCKAHAETTDPHHTWCDRESRRVMRQHLKTLTA